MSELRRAAVSCEAFEADVAELGVGTIDEPHRSALLAHASSCASCREVLDEVSDLADRLLLLAPEVEPPAGFEARALGSRATVSPRRRTWVMGAAVAAVLAFVAGTVVGVVGSGDTAPRVSARTAVVLTPAFAVSGSVEVSGDELTLTLGPDMPWPEEVGCEMRGVDGEWVRVATWSPDPRYGGEWTIEIEGALADSVEMRLVDGTDGEVLGRAFLAPSR